jgi:hypothetical protein
MMLIAGATLFFSSPTPWVLGVVYRDAQCSVPWAARTQRWTRTDACVSINAEGGSYKISSNTTHQLQQTYSDTQCANLLEPGTYEELGVCLHGAGGFALLAAAAAPAPQLNTIVHHFSNAADCSSAPMVVETYPANECYLPPRSAFYQSVLCDVPNNKATILASCTATCPQDHCRVTNITLGCAYPNEKYSCNV